MKIRLLIVLCLLATRLPEAIAQSEIRAYYQSEFLPLVNMIGHTKYVLQDGKRKEAGYTRSILMATDTFADGFIEISDVAIEERQEKTKGSAVNNAHNNYFNYEATLTSDTKLDRCIAVVTFGLGGTPSVYVESIGNLRPGKARKVKLSVLSKYDSVGRLHIFSGSREIRSTLVPDAYEVIRDEYATFRSQLNGVPISTLLGKQQAYPHRVSPSGRYLATFRDDGKTNRIVVFDLETLEKAREIELGEYDQSIYSLNWVNEDEFLFVMDNKLRRGNRETDTVEVLFKNIYWISSMLRSEPDKILLNSVKSNTFILFDLKEGKQEEKTNIGAYDSVWWDSRGVARIKKVYKGEEVRFFHRWESDERWRPLDELVTQEGLRFNYSGSDALNQTVFIDGFGSTNDKLYVYYNEDSTNNKFAEFDLTTGQISRVLLASKNYDLGGLDFIPECEVLRRDSDQQIIGVRYSTEKPSTRWYHPDFAYVQGLFDELFPDAVNLPIDWTDDATVMIFRSLSEKHPGKYYAFVPLQRRVIPLLDRLPQIADFELGDMKPVAYETRDGYTINGYLTTPPGYDGTTTLPAVVMPHGGPWVRDLWGFDSEVQFFATRGYAVFQPNYRGSVGYGTKHMLAGIGNIDTVMVDDIADGARWFVEQGVIDPANVFVFGHSYGGYAVYMSMIRYPELYKAGVAISAVAHYGEQIKSRKGNNYAYGFWNAALGSHKDEELMERVSPYFHADKIKGPLRIYHGNSDGVVPVEQSQLMEKALKNTEVDFKATYFDYEGHSFRYLQNISRYLGETEVFFRDNLATETEFALSSQDGSASSSLIAPPLQQ